MTEAEALERVMLEIALHRVELCHAVRDRSASREHDAAACFVQSKQKLRTICETFC